MPIDAATGGPTPRGTARHGRHEAGRRGAVVRLLRATGGPMSVGEIAERLGVHANTVRFHLETLVDNGQVERTTVHSGARGRPRQLYQAVRGMDPYGPRRYLELAEVLAASLAAGPDPRRRALEAGRAWGRRQASAARDPQGPTGPAGPVGAHDTIGRLIGLLDQFGFAPEPEPEPVRTPGGDRWRIGLRHCPFLELSVSRPEVVCPVHLGLMQGAMQSWRAPVAVDRLDAFVEPDRCLVHLSAGGAS